MSHSLQMVAWLIKFCLESPKLLKQVLDFSGDLINISVNEGGYTPMHGGISMNFPDIFVPGIKTLLQRGANPHLVCKSSLAYGGHASERFDTPTSLATRRSSSFFRWRQVICEVGFDVDNFVTNELKETPLVTSGWNVDSLTRLFRLDFEPLDLPQDLCVQCGRQVYHTFDRNEMWWEKLLDEIKGDAVALNIADTLSKSEDLCDQDDGIQECESPVSTSSSTSTESSGDIDLCWKCAVMRRTYGANYERGRL
ncbi:hypothetical protein T440DRAFT_258380 [Plenodomus tracheiphilus IPT5]|uniref:Ankyrin n=1 Tax=Plenodomus tracheiphilus IPT5 TaxID=1408161 RepID=A0A6A7AUL3_9PLEO|nr:hypothetical protein T440DRAFT_258380 [Plenodomus tracheiphilus IPT5]